jgi:hypothetical protein
MAFICNDCGNKFTRKFPNGKCPACDSFNIKSTHSVQDTKRAIREKEPKTLIELVIMCMVWGLLGYGVWDQYLRKEPAKEKTHTVEAKALSPEQSKNSPALDY